MSRSCKSALDTGSYSVGVQGGPKPKKKRRKKVKEAAHGEAESFLGLHSLTTSNSI